jgi:hypothetical protein
MMKLGLCVMVNSWLVSLRDDEAVFPMGFRQMLLAWKSTLVRDSQPIWGVVPKDLYPIFLAAVNQIEVVR